MNQNLFNKNLSQSTKLKNDDSTTRMKLGDSLFLCPIFDIKKYINNAKIYEKSAKQEKYKLPPLLNNLKKEPKNNINKSEIHTIANEHLPSYKNFFSTKKKSLDKSTTISNNNNSITAKNSDNRSYTLNNLNSTKDINQKIYETINLGENTKSKKYLDLESNSKTIETPKKNNIFNVKGENLNLLKTIKNIKKQVDSAHKDRSVKNIMGNNIAYSQKYSDLVFKPIRIINDYNTFQQRDLDKNRGDITKFINDNKDISKRNLLIKLLEKQKKDYFKAINLRQKSIDSSRRTIEIDENNYECYTTNQKQACRRIEKMLNTLNVKYRRLYNEEKKFRAELRIREDERQKLLEQIDEFRIIAKFVSRVLESNINLFKIKIIPDYNSDELPDYEKISDEVCKLYSFLLSEEERENDITPESINIIKEMNDLNDSELIHQFHKMEDNIVDSLKVLDVINKEVLILKRERKKQRDDIEKRIKILEDEFEYFKSSYEREKIEYEGICHRNETGNFKLGEIAIDLYHGVMNIFKEGKKGEESNTKKQSISVNNALLQTQKKIIEKEDQLKKLISTMESYEKSNRWLFYRVVHIRKNENKELKVNIKKQIIEEGEKEKMSQIRSPDDKIVFIRRKTEPPYQEPKKNKEVKIDPNLVSQLENEEMMSYK